MHNFDVLFLTFKSMYLKCTWYDHELWPIMISTYRYISKLQTKLYMFEHYQEYESSLIDLCHREICPTSQENCKAITLVDLYIYLRVT